MADTAHENIEELITTRHSGDSMNVIKNDLSAFMEQNSTAADKFYDLYVISNSGSLPDIRCTRLSENAFPYLLWFPVRIRLVIWMN